VEGLDEIVFENTSKAGSGDFEKWTWYFGNNTPTAESKNNVSRVYDDSGVYPVALVVKNQYGCLDSIVKAIKVEADFNVFVPDVFSPNGDGINEVFQPVSRGVKLYTFRIFNRWGQKIFETKDKDLGWDGTTGGKPSPTGVYVWQLNVSSIGGEYKELKGHVTLYR
jgi:gliding motility-associated-like protein